MSLPDQAYRISDVIYPTPLTRQPWVKSPLAIEVLEGLRTHSDPATIGSQKLFVSRNTWNTRQLVNEDAVFALLEQNGYVLAHPEKYTFAQQIALFSNARIVIGTLGRRLPISSSLPQA